jgi:hypothetical protein
MTNLFLKTISWDPRHQPPGINALRIQFCQSFDPAFYPCCDPPSQYDERWPVPPSWLWENAYEDDRDDVAWAFARNEGNNNEQTSDEPVEEDPSGEVIPFLVSELID